MDSSLGSYGDVRTKLNYERGIVGYTPVNYTEYSSAISFDIFSRNRQSVYSFVLRFQDHRIIKKSDIIAYTNWALLNKFDGSQGQTINLRCNDKTHSCKD